MVDHSQFGMGLSRRQGAFTAYKTLLAHFGRTHAELEARAADGSSGSKTFLAMPIVRGPSNVKFNEKFPAKLRFFAGFLTDFAAEDETDSAIEVSWRCGHVGDTETMLSMYVKCEKSFSGPSAAILTIL